MNHSTSAKVFLLFSSVSLFYSHCKPSLSRPLDLSFRPPFKVTKTPFIDSLELLLLRGSEEQASTWRSIPELVMAKVMDFLHIVTTLLFLLGLVEAVALRFANPEGAGPLSEVISILSPMHA